MWFFSVLLFLQLGYFPYSYRHHMRPQTTDYPPFYKTYIDKVIGENLLGWIIDDIIFKDVCFRYGSRVTVFDKLNLSKQI